MKKRIKLNYKKRSRKGRKPTSLIMSMLVIGLVILAFAAYYILSQTDYISTKEIRITDRGFTPEQSYRITFKTKKYKKLYSHIKKRDEKGGINVFVTEKRDKPYDPFILDKGDKDEFVITVNKAWFKRGRIEMWINGKRRIGEAKIK